MLFFANKKKFITKKIKKCDKWAVMHTSFRDIYLEADYLIVKYAVFLPIKKNYYKKKNVYCISCSWINDAINCLLDVYFLVVVYDNK